MNYNIDKYYTCKDDRPFKEIFINEDNKDMLKDLLESILNLNINEIHIELGERNTGNLKIRRKTYDALLKTNIGKIEIEINSGVEKYLYPRNMSYLCDLYSHHTLISEEYNEDTMIMQINFTYGLGLKQRVISTYKLTNEDNEEFVKNFQILELNMDYYMKLWYDNEEKGNNNSLIEKNKLLIMLGLEKKDLEKLSKDYKEVNKYMKKLDKLNQNPEFREYMTYEEDQKKIFNTKINEAKEKGIEKGIEKGSNKKALEIAKELLKDNININDIQKYTGLSIDEINNLKNE